MGNEKSSGKSLLSHSTLFSGSSLASRGERGEEIGGRCPFPKVSGIERAIFEIIASRVQGTNDYNSCFNEIFLVISI